MRYNTGVCIAVLFWSLSFVWVKEALEFISPVMLITIRVLIAAALLATFSKLSGRLQKVGLRDKFVFMGLSLVEPVGYFLFETAGIRMVPPTMACVVISLIPIFNPMVAAAVNGERPAPREWAGLAISFAGVLLVVAADGVENLGGRIAGILLLFGAVAASMVYTLTVQRLARRYNSFTIVSWGNIFAAMFLLPLVVILDRQGIASLAFSWDWASSVLALGILCSCVSFVLYVDGIRALGVTRTSMFVNLMPGMTAVASFLILGEELSAMKIAGIAVTITGLMAGTAGPAKTMLPR